jgi:hypothetical protein
LRVSFSSSRRVGKAQRAHHFKQQGGHGAVRLCPPYF